MHAVPTGHGHGQHCDLQRQRGEQQPRGGDPQVGQRTEPPASKRHNGDEHDDGDEQDHEPSGWVGAGRVRGLCLDGRHLRANLHPEVGVKAARGRVDNLLIVRTNQKPADDVGPEELMMMIRNARVLFLLGTIAMTLFVLGAPLKVW